MSGIPHEIPSLGSVAQVPRQNPEFSPGPNFTSEEYYVWSRCDGHASMKEIILMIGMGFDRGAAILDKLRQAGAILLEGETPESVAVPRVEASSSFTDLASADLSRAFPAVSVEETDLTPEEESALAAEVALSDEERRRIIAVRRQIQSATHFEVLGVAPDADKREIKRAYFKISKEFHPDRHYGHELGPFGEWLAAIFDAATRAFETLSDRRARAAYEASLLGKSAGGTQPQTREERAAELFGQACDLEVHGDAEQALRLFAAAGQLAPLPRYFRRAALCALSAGKLSEAAEYAKKAADLRPKDPSYLRVVAEVHRAAGRLQEAETTLMEALNIGTDNDKLLAELDSDLAAVRRALGGEGEVPG